MKKLLLGLLTGALVAVTAAAFAATREDYIATAKAEVPATCVMTGYEKDDDNDVQVYFRDKATAKRYKVEVDVITGQVEEVEIKAGKVEARKVVKTREEVAALVKAAYPDAQNLMIELDQDDDGAHYEVKFVTAKYFAEVDVHPVTGAFGDTELKYFVK